jgi:hypothetical protein
VILLDPDDILHVLEDVQWAQERGASVRVAVDEGYFKIKVGGGTWSPPLGVTEIED